MHNHLVGIYSCLFNLPIWAIVLILYAVTDCIVHIGREQLEGLAYQTSYSAKIGDAALIVVVLIATVIVQRGGVVVPGWLTHSSSHVLLGIICFLCGLLVCVLTLGSRSGQLVDVYHDVVIAPMFLYFAITLLPIIGRGGTIVERLSAHALISLWMLLVAFDITSNRMNQRKWLFEHGFKLR